MVVDWHSGYKHSNSNFVAVVVDCLCCFDMVYRNKKLVDDAVADSGHSKRGPEIYMLDQTNNQSHYIAIEMACSGSD